MASALTTTTQELGESRVRVDVEVASEAVEREVDRAARDLGRELKIPGFRKGKVPPQVVLQRVGRDAVMDQAVRRALPGWYEEAVASAGVAAVGDPQVDLSELPAKGAPLAFSIEVAVRPKAKLGKYEGLEVGRREPQARPEDVEEQLERLREAHASLEPVERPAAEGDFVVVDYAGTIDGEPFEGGEGQGQTLELGSGTLIPGFEQQLLGAKPGERREVRVTFPDDYKPERLAGMHAAFMVEVKEVREKRLPDLDDEFASTAGGFDTLAELRADIERTLRELDERAVEREFREAALDAAVVEAKIDLPHELVHAKAHEMWHRAASRLAREGIDPQRYVQLTGKSEEDLVKEAEPDAEQSLRREAVLAAVAEQEGIGVSDDELLEALREASVGPRGEQPSDKALQRALDRAREQGRDAGLREDIAMRKAVDLIAESAKPIPIERARARDKVWTPEKGAAAAGEQRIWTPGSGPAMPGGRPQGGR